MNRQRFAFLFLGLGAVPGLLAAAGPSYPVTPTITARVVPADDTESGCSAAHESLRESAGAEALVSAVLPKLVEVGIASLSAALHAASGEDRKTRTYDAAATSMAYDYDTQAGVRTWARQNGCLVVTSAGDAATAATDAPVPAGEQASREPNFRAVIPINISNDRTAMAFELPVLTYRSMLAPGRRVEQMTMAITVTNAAGQEVARGLLLGPFVPAKSTYQARQGEAPTTGWLPLPPLSAPVTAAVANYDTLCDTRQASTTAFLAAETAKVKARKLPKAEKKKALEDLQALPKADPAAPCGKVLPDGVEGLAYGWTTEREHSMADIRSSIERHEPVTFHVIVTETRNVNGFLLAMSKKLEGDQPALRDALVGLADPVKRRERDAAQEAADETKAKKKVTDKLAYEVKLAEFTEKARLYHRAVELVATAQNKAIAAQAKADASPDNSDLASAAEQAQGALETTRVNAAEALSSALSAKQSVLEAAITADVLLSDAHPVRRFPD